MLLWRLRESSSSPTLHTDTWLNAWALPTSKKSSIRCVYAQECWSQVSALCVFCFFSNSRSNSVLTCSSDGSIFQSWEVGLPTSVCSCAPCQNYAMSLGFFFCILSLRLFKQHGQRCFQYLGDKEKQRKQYSDDTMNGWLRLLTINPTVTIFRHVSVSKDVNPPTRVPKLLFPT